MPAAYLYMQGADAADDGVDASKSAGFDPQDGAAPVESLDSDATGGSSDADSDGSTSSLAGSPPGEFGLPDVSPGESDRVSELSRLLSETGATMNGGEPLPVPRLELPLPPVNPLRAALVAWVTSTGQDVPEDEFQQALADADRLPADVQLDLAILISAAVQANELQRDALSALTDEEIAWLEENPQAARALTEGAKKGTLSPDATRAAELAAKVDGTKSIQATLLMLDAVSRTRDNLRDAAASGRLDPDALQGPMGAAVPENVLSFLDVVSAAKGETLSAEDKLRIAGDLIAVTSGLEGEADPRPFTPDLPAKDPLPVALVALVDAANPTRDAEEDALLEPHLARARALPQDLQRALALVVLSRAEAISGVRDVVLSGGDADAVGLVDAVGALQTLSAMERALPVLQKYSLVYTDAGRRAVAPVTEPTLGYVQTYRTASGYAESAGRLEHTVRAAGLAQGVRAEAAMSEAPDFLSALNRLHRVVDERPITPQEQRDMRVAVANLPLPVQRAGAIITTATLDAHVLRDEAFADLSAEELDFLMENGDRVQALVADEESWTTAEEVAFLSHYAELAERVDKTKLLASAITLARGTDLAHAILAEAGYGADTPDVQAQATGTREVSSGWRGLVDRAWSWLKGLSPFGTAEAQGTSVGCPTAHVPDVLFCDPIGYVFILGQGETTLAPRSVSDPHRIPIVIDLGGTDTYAMAVGAYGETWTRYENCATPASVAVAADPWRPGFPVGVLLEMGGDDVYDVLDTLPQCTGAANAGESPLPWRGAQAAALGGVGIILDAAGGDTYSSYSHTQGYGWHGVGVLADLRGDDAFVAHELAQGASFSGFGLHLGILVNGGGVDAYNADKGQGYGVGGVFVELAGEEDAYRQGGETRGFDTTAYLHLDQEPGKLHGERGNYKVWRDGPSVIHLGVGLDTDAQSGDQDGDNFPTFVEELIGSDPEHPASTPDTALQDYVQNQVLLDSDQDGFADVVENAMGTDPQNPRSAPAGLPGLPGIAGSDGGLAPLFQQYDALLGSNDSTGANGPYESDKILDVRVPFPGNGVTVASMCDGYASWAFPRTMTGDILYSEGSGTLNPGHQMGGTPEEQKEKRDDEHGAVGEQNVTGPGGSAMTPDYAFVNPAPCGDKAAEVDGFTAGASVNTVTVRIPPSLRGGGNTTASDDGNVTQSGGAGEDGTEDIVLRTPPGIFALGNVGGTLFDVDYLLSIDLGGQDTYTAAAGGGTFLRFANSNVDASPGVNSLGAGNVLAPVGLTTFDVDVPQSASVGDNAWGADRYIALTDEDAPRPHAFAHGAGGGILVDTEGNDQYAAGDFSQGALAGLLLDLQGKDKYSAGKHAQGANVALPFELNEDVNSLQNHGHKGGEQGPAERRMYTAATHAYSQRAALLLDFSGLDEYNAGDRSQGYGYGLIQKGAGLSRTPDGGWFAETVGALVDFGGRDRYTAGEFAQGVARGGGTGLLVDADVAQATDIYTARGDRTMGAIEPEHIDRYGNARPTTPSNTAGGLTPQDLGGLGLLLDFSGVDFYTRLHSYGPERITDDRQDRVTTRTETASLIQNDANTPHVISGLGVHADFEFSNADRDQDGTPDFFESLAGTDTRSNETVSDRNSEGWIVHIPTARLAIGGTNPQSYTRDYAFVVDFGGDNVHVNNAGGPVTELVVAEGGLRHTKFLLTAFPTTFVYEVAKNDTVYTASRDLAQGTGYFTTGLLLDEGGADTFTVEGDPRAAFPSRWTTRPPVMNGDIRAGAPEWAESANTTRMTLLFEEIRTPGRFKDVEFYVANDQENAYFGIQYEVPSKPGESALDVLKQNEFWMFFDKDFDEREWLAGDQAIACNRGQGATQVPDGTEIRVGTPGLDAVRLFTEDPHSGRDGLWDMTFGLTSAARDRWRLDCDVGLEENQHVDGRRAYRDGKITVEIAKPLGSGDAQDLALLPDGLGGWTNPSVGFRMNFTIKSTGEKYVWPPNSAAFNGEYGTDALYTDPSNLADNQPVLDDELTTWALLEFAGRPSRIPSVVHEGDLNGVVGVPFEQPFHDRVLTQGAGVGGVGVLATLGNSGSSGTFDAHGFSQGFGGWHGIGLLYDGGGSDRYSAKEFSLGAVVAEGSWYFDTLRVNLAPSELATPAYATFGTLYDADGNDVYVAERDSLGHYFANDSAIFTLGTAPRGLALFMDTGGVDTYEYGADKQTMAGKTAPPSDNLFWTGTTGVGGYGVDNRFYEEYVYDWANDLYGFEGGPVPPPRIVPLLHPLNETAVCQMEAALETPATRFGQYVNDSVCLEVAVYLPPGHEADFTVERVDILVGGKLLETITERDVTAGHPVAPGRAVSSFVLPEWDPGEAGDGPREVKIRAYFSPTVAQGGLDPFVDDRVLVMREEALRILVDTPPRVTRADIGPVLPAGELAAFSPHAVGRTPYLDVDYAVSRDLGEDLYKFFDYKPSHTNRECQGSGACDVIPFYMRQSGGWVLKNEPPSGDDQLQVKFDDNTPEGAFTLTLPSAALTHDIPIADGNGLGFWVYRDFLPVAAPSQWWPPEAGTVDVTTRVLISKDTQTNIIFNKTASTVVNAPRLDNALRPATNQLRAATGADIGGLLGGGGGSSGDRSAMQVCSVSDLVRTCSPTSAANPVAQGPSYMDVVSTLTGRSVRTGAGDVGAASAHVTGHESICREPEGGDDGWVCFTVDTTLENGETLVFEEGHQYEFKLLLEYPPQTVSFSTATNAMCTVGGIVKNLAAALGYHGVYPCLVSLSNVPLADVLWYFNTPDYPSRMEVLVPSNPSTDVAFQVERVGAANATIGASGAISGDVAQRFTWAGGDPSHFPDSRYNITLTPTSFTTAGHPLMGEVAREDETGDHVTLPFLLDRRAPVVTIDTPSTLGNPLLTSAREMQVKWTATDPGTDAVPASGSGVDKLDVFVAPFTPEGRIPAFPGPAWSLGTWRDLTPQVPSTFYRTTGNSDDYIVIVIARDRVGNIDGLRTADGRPLPFDDPACGAGDTESCVRAAVDRAVQQKIALFEEGVSVPGIRHVRLDLSTPQILADSMEVQGGGRGLVKGVERLIVQAGSPVQFRACVNEQGSGIRAVQAFFVREPDHPGEAVVAPEPRTMTPVGGGCYAYSAWGNENTNPILWPNGNWTVGVQVRDNGENRAERLYPLKVYLDGNDPVANAEIVLPEGQTAVRPGQDFRVVVSVSDATGVQSVTADVPGLSTTPTRELRSLPGRNTFETTVRVDAEGVTEGVHPITWRVTDGAGNTISGQLEVEVSLQDYEIEAGSLRVVATTHDSVTVAWNTTAPATSAVRYGFRQLESDLTRGTDAATELVTEHRVTVPGLTPSTRHFLKAVSVDHAGLERSSEMIEAVTRTALYVQDLNVQSGDALSGMYPFEWTGGMRGNGDPVKFTVYVRDGDAPWDFLTTLTESGAAHTARVNTSRLLDGDNYSFRLVAEAARDSVEVEVGPVTLDNTLPELTLGAGRTATRETRPTFEGSAFDALSGLDASSFTLTVDGTEHPSGAFSVSENATGHATFRYVLPEPLEIGPHDVVLTVSDHAGNVRSEAWTLHVDIAPPHALVNAARYDPGPEAAGEGATVILNVTASDPAGIDRITANVSALTTAADTIPFARIPGTDHYEATFVVTEPERDGAFQVPIRIVDRAGNAVSLSETVRVDTAAPAILGHEVRDSGLTSARLAVTATEPVLVEVAYDARGSTGTAQTSVLRKDVTLAISDILPSRTYAYTVTVTDAAGNVATAEGSFVTDQDTEAPSGVAALSFFDRKDGRVRLEWPAAQDEVGVSHYRIYRSDDGETWTLLAETTETFYEESGLPLEKVYHYAVAAVDHGGNEGPRSPLTEGASTSPPVLVDGSVTPDVGSTHTTTFKWTVTYRSAGGVAPSYVRVVIDGVPHDMRLVDGEEPRDGLTYAYESRLGPTKLDAPHSYHFEASDGRYIVKFPDDQPVKGPVVSADLLAEDDAGLVSFAKRIPFAGVGGMLLVLAAAAAILVITRRRSLK